MSMYGWSFSARTFDEVKRLLRSMGKHRYVGQVDLRLHWTVDAALRDTSGPAATACAEAYGQHQERVSEGALDPLSRDPGNWRALTSDELGDLLEIFWGDEAASDAAEFGGQVTQEQAAQKLTETLRAAGFAEHPHPPFESDDEEPPHPELVLLDWLFLPIDQLDSDRHKGVLVALLTDREEVHPSEPVYVEGPALSEVELTSGAKGGALLKELTFWAEGPYNYCDYVFRGVTKAAKLVDLPVGYRDIE